MRKEMAMTVFFITKLIGPIVNRYFHIMLLVPHWFPDEIYRGKQCLQYIITLEFQGESFILTYYSKSSYFKEPISNLNFHWCISTLTTI